MMQLCQHAQLMKSWVFIRHSKAVFNVDAMENYLKFTFLIDFVRCCTTPREDGLLSLGLFKQMSSDFVVLGRKVGGELFDLLRTGMIKKESEFKEYIFFRDSTSLGLLGGTPGANAAGRAKAKAKAKGVPTAAEKKRNALSSRVGGGLP